MENRLTGAADILNSHISGFHQFILKPNVHLTFVSQNFCEMTGCTQDELLSDTADLYAGLVFPEDYAVYSDFIRALTQKEQTLSAQYRIVLKNGTVRYVNDTITSKFLADGTLAGYSVLTDITAIKQENDNLNFLNETIPCGFIKYTCEKQPRVLYVNEQLLNILHFPKNAGSPIGDSDDTAGQIDYFELYKNNIYLMIAPEERRKFTHFLNRVYTQGTPIAGEISVLRCDGTKARLYGWVTRRTGADGEEEFQSVCMDVTERYLAKKAAETERYLNALSDVYDKIFEFDLSAKTVKCICGQNSEMFRWLLNIPMQMTEATEKWIQGTVVEEDRARVRQFFADICGEPQSDSSHQPPQITYRALSSKGIVRTYSGIVLKLDSSVSLFCCRSISDQQETDLLRNENVSLKHINESMQDLMLRFTEGIVAFKVEGDLVTPLYVSDNVCEFFGYTREEWLELTRHSHSIKSFVSHSDVAYEDFMELLKNGEAEFEYFDNAVRKTRRIKAICSQKSADGQTPRYVMLYNLNDSEQPESPAAEGSLPVYIRTFGYFDVFVGGNPIAFKNKKSKELFALLVDRRGGYVSSEEAISFLWEDETVNAVTLARYRKVALRLKNILEEYGIAEIMESVDGKRRIVADRVQCDLYDYLTHKEEFAQLFKGSYLTNYSWGETTLGELLSEHVSL